jgi:signal transduction histidine kinase
VLTVEDDGVGFEVDRVRAEKASQGHLGLVGIEERARQCRGSLAITSTPGVGTKAVASLAV